jgi:hypothetical protein
LLFPRTAGIHQRAQLNRPLDETQPGPGVPGQELPVVLTANVESSCSVSVFPHRGQAMGESMWRPRISFSNLALQVRQRYS